MNGMTAHVLFNSVATLSFMSLGLNKKFDDALRVLDYLLEVKIFDDRIVNALRVHWDFVLKLFHEKCVIE